MSDIEFTPEEAKAHTTGYLVEALIDDLIDRDIAANEDEAYAKLLSYVISDGPPLTGVQDRIARAVEARGYRENWRWDDNAFIARQIAKIVEELAEASDEVGWYGLHQWPAWHEPLRIAGHEARRHFDDGSRWHGIEWADRKGLAAELVDIIIPCLVAADVLGVDLLALAAEKATADVERGIR